jgi:hypothetical protein
MRPILCLVMLLCACGPLVGLEIQLFPVNTSISITKMPEAKDAPTESLTINHHAWTVLSYTHPKTDGPTESEPDRAACEALVKEIDDLLRKMIVKNGFVKDFTGDKYSIIITTETGIINVAMHSGDRSGIKKIFDQMKAMLK